MHPEQFAASTPEHEPHSSVLYEYKLVLDALAEHGHMYDDIDYLAGVVVGFNEMIPSWTTVEELRKMGTYLEPESAAIPLVQEAVKVLTDEYWAQVHEVDTESAAILAKVPGLIYAYDRRTSAVFLVESFSLSADRASAAQMYAHGEGTTQACRRHYLEAYIDANQLPPDERALLDRMVSEQEITPFRP